MALFDNMPVIETDDLILRRLEASDAPAILELKNDPVARRYLPTFLLEFQYEDPKEAIRAMYDEAFPKKEGLFLAICPRAEEGAMVGVAELYSYKPQRHKVSIGYRLNRRFWGKGYGKLTVQVLKAYLFEQTEITCLSAHAIGDNKASCRILEGAGFYRRKQGVMEDWGLPEEVSVNKYVLNKNGIHLPHV
ncbi:MAG: GNAT family N-acetyltransferase [Lachnospiraceae bacterium]|nr:GNAT family N-acetyltransferase [Lachnospiraceae bacterium]